MTAPALSPGSTYAWWVRAFSSTGNATAWSSQGRFAISPIAAPVAIGPVGSQSSDALTFTWTAAIGAAKYDLWLQDFASGAVVAYRTGLVGTTWTAPTLSPGRTYQWWLRSVSTNGTTSAWNSAQTFSIAALTVPVLGNPSGALATDSATFTWSAASLAVRYDIYLSNNTTGATQVVSSGNMAGNNSPSWASPALSPGSNYTWWVRSVSADGTFSAWSVSKTFTTPALATPTLTSPTGTLSTDTTTFAWTGVSLATKYDIYLSNNTTGATQVLRTGTLTGVANPTFASPALSPGGNYTWWVRAVSADGTVGAWSVSRSFSVAALGLPVLAGPIGAQATTTPTYQWSGVSLAEKYDIYLTNNTTGASQTIRTGNLAGQANPTFASPALTPGSNYTWWVRAVSTDGTLGAWSVSKTFSTPALTVPVVTGPTGSGNSTTPTFAWNAVAIAARYDLYVSDATTGQDQVVRNTNLTGTSWTLTGVPSLVSGHKYRFWLRAISVDGSSHGARRYRLRRAVKPGRCAALQRFRMRRAK
ncbi:MAG: hypothetical protein U0744_12980 [Gemmataceae bacterium]